MHSGVKTLGHTTSIDKVAIVIQSRRNEELCFYKQHRYRRVELLAQLIFSGTTDTKTVALLKLNTLIQGISQNTVFGYKCVINEG